MENTSLIHPITDYSELLKIYGLEYSAAGYYWQVGVITQTQGWILHLSVIKAQVQPLLRLVIPLLIAQNISFKIAQNWNTITNLLDGALGYIHLGKIVSIYPHDHQEIESLAQQLIEITQPFKGPVIPTDRHLGSIVYTRYGSFKPTVINNAQGEPIKHIYDQAEQLVPDPYSIPFALNKGIRWPFINITEPTTRPTSKLLNYTYYPLSILKPDAKGNVIKALYFKKIWKIWPCLIKQGHYCMFMDEAGRDIQNRLQWQYELYQALNLDIPMPEVFDYFQENGDTYLAMAFIKGISLRVWVDTIYKGGSWLNLSICSRLKLLDILLSILAIIQRLHDKGYVHRDITSHNFLVDKKEKIWLIDMELAWSLNKNQPNPPFALGTPGYMSPEQNMQQQPTLKEDIYGVGALAVEFLTNLYPIKLNQESPDMLQKALIFFTEEKEISALITTCQSSDPTFRPTLFTLRNALEQFRNKINKSSTPNPSSLTSPPSDLTIKKIVQAGLQGIAHPDLLSSNHDWLSVKQRQEDHIGNQQIELDLYEGWHTGMAGPLWLVARSKTAGYDIEDCLTAYINSWKYIELHYFKDPTKHTPGLYLGGAGIAMALVEGLNSGLLTPDSATIGRLKTCFSLSPPQLDLSMGLAGQGIALLHSARWLDNAWRQNLLTNCVDNIINEQQSDGSWNIFADSRKRKDIFMGLDSGIAGVILFLLAYFERYPQRPVKVAIEKSLRWLIENNVKVGDSYVWPISTQKQYIDKWGSNFGIPGITLAFIKAYTILKKPIYQETAERSLLPLSSHPVHMDFSLGSGLAGLGEIYLEAFQAFNNPIWQERANWIANVFINSFKKRKDKSGYWLLTTTELTTADLFTGNSGALCFLIHQQASQRWNHPLWPK